MYKKKEDTEWQEAASLRDAAKKTGAFRQNIRGICNKKRYKSSKGYIFKWKEQPDLEGENWELLKGNPWIDHDFGIAEISNKGQIKSCTGKHWYRKRLSLVDIDEWESIEKLFYVHRLLVAVFKTDLLEELYQKSLKKKQ